MIRALTNFLFRLATRNMSMPAERTFWLIMELAVQYKLLMALILVFGVLLGLLEGIAMAALASAVYMITSEPGTCLDALQRIAGFFGVDLCGRFDREDTFFLLLAVAVCAQIAKSVIQYVNAVIGAHLEAKVNMQLQSKVVTRLMSIEYKMVNSYTPGEKQNLLKNAGAAVQFLRIVNTAISTICVFIAYLVILFYTNWKLSIITGAVILGILFVVFPLLKKLRVIGKKARQMGIQLSAQTIEYLQAIRLVRLYGRTEYVKGFIQSTIWETVRLKRAGTLWGAPITPAQEIIIVITAVLILYIGYISADPESTKEALPLLLAYVMVLHRCNGRLSSINTIRSTIAKRLPALEHAADFFEQTKSNVVEDIGEEVDEGWSEIALDSVSFRYDKQTPYVAEDISLTISRGERIAFVGPSGAGKSTIIDLICGLYEPTAGSIKIGGLDSVSARPGSWYSMFSVVSQNDLILNASVKENLKFANPKATREEIVEASKIADAHEFITAMQDGYDAMLGERGDKISGGQIQRLAFARAVLKESPILILDEATSALDVLTEKRITNALLEFDNSRTILLIAHRLSTVMNADRIVVLDQGKIVDVGPHAELLSRDGLYKEMWQTQSVKGELG